MPPEPEATGGASASFLPQSAPTLGASLLRRERAAPTPQRYRVRTPLARVPTFEVNYDVELPCPVEQRD
jgi:hypothetical protein